MKAEEQVLVSYVLISYNQELYIEAALKSALYQDYENLEIIIFDDSSTDKTYEIIRNCLQNYIGFHKVFLNRNKRNLGVAGNLQSAHQITQGEIIVHAAGDDISELNRVRELVKKFQSVEEGVSAVCSNATLITNAGQKFGLMYKNKTQSEIWKNCDPLYSGVHVSGATLAITRDLKDMFGDYDRRIFAEDVVYLRRALLHRGVAYIPKALVRYRISENSVSRFKGFGASAALVSKKRWTKDRVLRWRQYKKDLGKVSILVNPEIHKSSLKFRNHVFMRYMILSRFRRTRGAYAALICYLVYNDKNGVADYFDRWFYGYISLARTIRDKLIKSTN